MLCCMLHLSCEYHPFPGMGFSLCPTMMQYVCSRENSLDAGCGYAFQCSKILKLPCTTTFSKMLPGGISIVLPSVATMMTVPVRQKFSQKNQLGVRESMQKAYPSV